MTDLLPCPIPVMARTGWADRDGNAIYALIAESQIGSPAQRGGFTEDQAARIIAACEAANARHLPAIPDPAEAITDEMVERACARHHYIVTRGDWQEWTRTHPSLAKRDRGAMRSALIAAGKE